MKTPKRDYFSYAEHDIYTVPGTTNKLSSRWKRKNRVKQLKRTIARLKREKEEAYHRGHQAGYDLCFARQWF